MINNYDVLFSTQKTQLGPAGITQVALVSFLSFPRRATPQRVPPPPPAPKQTPHRFCPGARYRSPHPALQGGQTNHKTRSIEGVCVCVGVSCSPWFPYNSARKKGDKYPICRPWSMSRRREPSVKLGFDMSTILCWVKGQNIRCYQTFVQTSPATGGTPCSTN